MTPDSVYDCDTDDGRADLLRRRPVLPLPGGAEYDPAEYEQHRVWATAPDGTRVPISLVCRAGTPRDGRAPFVLYGYGSYETCMDPWFSIARLSLLDRGFVFAVAHIRGGGELGRRWYDDGKMLHKMNTFTDFVACARHLVSDGWTSPRPAGRAGRLGRRPAGGRGANLAPDAFAAIVAQVPFVDALTTILDPSLPLTVTEWEEWGNPLDDPEVYAYMKSYSPYENVATDRPYPAMLARHQPQRHPGALPRAGQVDRPAAGRGAGRPVPAEDRDGRRARRAQRPLRRVARGSLGAGLDRGHRRRPPDPDPGR